MIWALLAVAAIAAPFARVVGPEARPALELASRDYAHPDGSAVRLVGVSHVAEAAFYEAVQGQLGGLDRVLYEGVRGVEERGRGPGLNAAYAALADGLGLVFQHQAMTFEGAGWVNSDLDVDELADLLGGSSQSLAGLLDDGRSARRMARLGRRAARSPRVRVLARVQLIESLPRAEAELEAALGPGGYEAVVLARNDRVHADLERARGQSVGVLYGAAHLRDLEARLLAEGFEPGPATWRVAIGVDPEREGLSPERVAALRRRVVRRLDRSAGRARAGEEG